MLLLATSALGTALRWLGLHTGAKVCCLLRPEASSKDFSRRNRDKDDRRYRLKAFQAGIKGQADIESCLRGWSEQEVFVVEDLSRLRAESALPMIVCLQTSCASCIHKLIFTVHVVADCLMEGE